METGFRGVPGICRNRRSRFLPAALCLALLPLSGCLGHHYIRTDFKAYETSFADTSNRELLLNLARLENRDPAYFFKMGQITSSYRMQGSLTGSGQMTSTSGAVQIPNGGGTVGAIFENDPTFQFIPVNDDTNARLLMAPIQSETFYALYEQGWRLDLLFRLMVDRIEVTTAGQHAGCSVEIFRNIPPSGSPNDTPMDPAHTIEVKNRQGEVAGYYVVDDSGRALYSVTKDRKTRYDAVALSHYVTFLRVSALVYELQKRGILILRGTSAFVPYDSHAMIPDPPAPAGQDQQTEAPGQTPPPPASGQSAGQKTPGESANFDPKNQNDAAARNDIWERTKDEQGREGWILGHKVFSAVFYLSPIQQCSQEETGAAACFSNPDDVSREISSDLGSDLNLNALQSGPGLSTVLHIMSRGFSLEGTPGASPAAQDVCPASSGPEPTATAHLFMRSIIELMAESAQEQKAYQQLASDDPPVPPDPQNPLDHSSAQTFSEDVPLIENRPVLRLQWDHPDSTLEPVVEVSYRGETYRVSDESSPAVIANATWNRDVFRLIEGLSSQVTVDISKFPLPEILQLHSD